jgi:GTP pyrophosphokinase
MNQTLRSGDQVEILTSPAAHPTLDWLSRVSGPSARQRIRRYLRRAERERLQAAGKTTLLRYLRKLRLPLPKTQSQWDDLAKELQYPTVAELLHAVAVGTVGRAQVEALRPHEEALLPQSGREGLPRASRGVRLGDLRAIAVRFAECCRPIPGDRIVAMVTRGRGASIHRSDCANAFRGDPARWIELEWDVAPGEAFTAYLSVLVGERRTVLADLESAIQGMKGRLVGLDIVDETDRSARVLRLVVTLTDTSHLERVLVAIKKLPGVLDASRGSRGRDARAPGKAIR